MSDGHPGLKTALRRSLTDPVEIVRYYFCPHCDFALSNAEIKQVWTDGILLCTSCRRKDYEEMTKKTELATRLANIVVNRWILSGDQPEEKRAEYVRTMTGEYMGLSMATLDLMKMQLTYPKGTGE